MPTLSQLQDPELRAQIRQRIKAGRLPVMTVTRIAAGYGFGHVCAACDKPITNPQVEYELADYRDGRRLCFHQGCHVAWQLECAAAAPPHKSILPLDWCAPDT